MKGFLWGVRGIFRSPCPKQVEIIGKDTEAAVLCFLKLFLRGFLPGLGLFYLSRRFPVLIGNSKVLCQLYGGFFLSQPIQGGGKINHIPIRTAAEAVVTPIQLHAWGFIIMERAVRAIVLTWKTNFGTTKICFDVSMAVIAAILSFVFTGHLNGVREGTIIAALLVGFIARVLGKKLAFVKPLLFPEEFAGENVESTGKSGAVSVDKPADEVQRNVIVIGRQFGSGGHDIGKALAEKLGYAFYDQEIIEMTAGTTGYTPEFIQKKEEMMTSSFLYDLVNQMYMYAQPDEEAPKDKIYEAESKVVRELAAKGNCVIVGRCSDYTLRDNKNCLRVFFCAPMENRMKRVMDRLHLSEKDAKQKIQKEDKWRADNYRYYTGRIWGASANFDLTVNTALGEEYIEICIREAMKR